MAKKNILRPQVISCALAYGTRIGGPRVHYGAILGPGRALLRVLWALNVSRAGSFSRDGFPPDQGQSGRWKPTQKKTTRRISHVLRCETARTFSWSPGYVAARAWSHGSPRVSNSSTAVALRVYVFVDGEGKYKYHKQRCNCFRFGVTAVDLPIEV